MNLFTCGHYKQLHRLSIRGKMCVLNKLFSSNQSIVEIPCEEMRQLLL